MAKWCNHRWRRWFGPGCMAEEPQEVCSQCGERRLLDIEGPDDSLFVEQDREYRRMV